MVRKLMFFCLILTFNFAFGQTPESSSTPAAPADSNVSEKASYVLCKNGNVVRTLRVQISGKSCKAIYTKEGSDQEVGKAQKADVCFDVVSKIRVNLEKNKWKCKDISQTRVSSSLE